MPTLEDLKNYQGLDLDLKIELSKDRIRQWLEVYGSDGVYISFSGGKDSTVLLHLVRDIAPDVPAVFVNTGLEYPEIQQFARSFENVETLTPKRNFKQILTLFGYPFISKEVSANIRWARTGGVGSRYYEKLFGIGHFAASKYATPKYKACFYLDFNIAPNCCNVMKKSPVKNYEKKTGRHPFIGMLAEESRVRTTNWLRHGCNAFDNKRPNSNPLSFWTEQDILTFIKSNGIKLASVYGNIVQTDPDGYEYEQVIGSSCPYKTTGCTRTGCMFCGFGAHLDKGEGRFVRLKKTHPKQYNYCMDGGAMTVPMESGNQTKRGSAWRTA